MLGHDMGVLAATTAFGKTVVAAWLIAQRGVNTLVLVHRRQLLDQWVERLSSFLNINNREIGRIGGGRRKPTGRLDVAVIQSLVRKGVVDDCIGEYGHVIVDECHHLSAHSFEQVVRRAKARFVTGIVGNGHAEGWPSSDHLHAVRPGAASREREGGGDAPSFYPQRARASDSLSAGNAVAFGQACRVSFALRGTDRRRIAESPHLRGCNRGRRDQAARRSCSRKETNISTALPINWREELVT